MQKWTILVGSVALALSLGSAAAQAAASKPHSAISIQCSKEADAKGLHGKARKHFRSQCKRSSKPGTTTGKS